MHPILCIDFGSAYTKVAFRGDRQNRSVLVEHPNLNFDELRICIPTLVAVSQRSGSSQWKCGIEAVDIKEGNGVKVYTNWKQHLFSRTAPFPKTGKECQETETDLLEDLEAVARERKHLIT